MKSLSYNEEKFNQVAPGCRAEYINYMPRGREGIRCWEIKAQTPEDDYIIVVLKDYGYTLKGEAITITPFTNREGRNEELSRLYSEKGLSQTFLANLFNMSQPAVSLIINNKNK